MATLHLTALSQTRIADGAIVGNLYLPETGGRHPAVIVIGGSEGGVEWSAPLGAPLAQRGFAALALAYFGTDPLPQRLQTIPLEYFKLAIDRLGAHPSVDPARIGLIGFSKGAEAALLTAATYPDIKAVVASAPSHVAWQGVTGDPATVAPSWTYKGVPVPFVPFDRSQPFTTTLDAYTRSLANRRAIEAAAIHVERIQGPILLFSGTDDKVWPSTLMAHLIIDRLARARFPMSYEHVRFDGAGHPVLGVPQAEVSPVPPRILLRLGGTGEINAKARGESWRLTLEFLERFLSTNPGVSR
jgi:dienelactone hydrolase